MNVQWKMELYISIVTYILVVVLVSYSLYVRLKIRSFSALIVALIFGLIYLMVVHQPLKLIGERDPLLIVLYLLILSFTPVVVVLYALYRGIFDYRQM